MLVTSTLLRRIIISAPVLSRFTSTAPLTPVPLKVNIPIAWKLPEDYSQYFSTQPPKTTPKYPTKPINGYMEYVKENYKSFKDKTPNANVTEILKTMAFTWKSLPFSDKHKYYKTADESRQKYKKQVKEFYENFTPEQVKSFKATKILEKRKQIRHLKYLKRRRAIRKLDKPKKPLAAFFLFLKTLDRGEASVIEFTKGAAEKWKLLPQEEKQKYNDRAKEALEEFNEKVKAWENNMISKGHVDVIRRRVAAKLPLDQRKALGVKKSVRKASKKSIRKRASSGKVVSSKKKVVRKSGAKLIKEAKKKQSSKKAEA